MRPERYGKKEELRQGFVTDINIAENRSVRAWGLLGAKCHQSLTSASLLREFPFFHLANQQRQRILRSLRCECYERHSRNF